MKRVLAKYEKIDRSDPSVGRYYANCHKQQKRNPDRFLLYMQSNMRSFDKEGLNTVKYKLETKNKSSLFTHIFISYDDKTRR